MEVDEDVPVDVKVKDDVKFGTVYGITVPVSKVKAEFDAENEAYMISAPDSSTTTRRGRS